MESLKNNTQLRTSIASLLPGHCSASYSQVNDSSLKEAIKQKAFSCLPDDLHSVIVERYVNFVHPQLPVLDLNTLIGALTNPRRQQSMSFLVWQALTTAASPFLTESDLGKAGLVANVFVVERYFHRTKVLLDIRYEKNRFATLQTLLLLCAAPAVSQEVCALQEIFLERATLLADDLASYITKDISRSYSQHGLIKRLWWSCFILRTQVRMSKWPCVSTRRTASAQLSPPSLADFETDWMSSHLVQSWFQQSKWRKVQAATYPLTLASFFCKKAELCARWFLAISSVHEISKFSTRESKASGAALPLSNCAWLAMRLMEESGIWQARHRLRNHRDDCHSPDTLATLVHCVVTSMFHCAMAISLLQIDKSVEIERALEEIDPHRKRVCADLREWSIKQITDRFLELVQNICALKLPLILHNVNWQLSIYLGRVAHILHEEVFGADNEGHHPHPAQTSFTVLMQTLHQYEHQIRYHPSRFRLGIAGLSMRKENHLSSIHNHGNEIEEDPGLSMSPSASEISFAGNEATTHGPPTPSCTAPERHKWTMNLPENSTRRFSKEHQYDRLKFECHLLNLESAIYTPHS